MTVSRSGALTNTVAIVASASTVALFSLDCRRAIRRTWRQRRTGQSQTLMLGALGFLGFAIGLIAGAAR